MKNKKSLNPFERLITSTDLLERAVSSSQDVSGATFLPDLPKCSECIMDINKSFKLNDLKYGGSLTALRIEGLQKSVDEREKNLIHELKLNNYKYSILEIYQSEIFWNKIKNLEAFSSTKNNILRVVIPPSQCIQFIFQLNKNFRYYIDVRTSANWFFDTVVGCRRNVYCSYFCID